MTRLMQWAIAAALICGATVFTSCSKDDNPVDPADNLAEKIIGKWIFAERNGVPTPTNKKRVFSIVSATKAYVSASRGAEPTMAMKWIDHTEADVVISGNKMTLTMQTDEHTTVEDEFIINNIGDTEFTANLRVTVTVDGTKEKVSENILRLIRVNRDYSESVIGLWECKGLKGDETFNDGNDRLEFFEDGTYKYWHKNDAGEWETVTTREFQNYFVDGSLLATRWKNIDEDELREWWDIATIKGDKMQWKALRANDDGTTFEQVMDWEKVEE